MMPVRERSKIEKKKLHWPRIEPGPPCKKEKNLHWPGIEPGPPAWQARILPLNHQCRYVLFNLRPEADDVRAMQQQLSSLHLVMEQSSAENERQVQQLQGEKQRLQEDKNR